MEEGFLGLVRTMGLSLQNCKERKRGNLVSKHTLIPLGREDIFALLPY